MGSNIEAPFGLMLPRAAMPGTGVAIAVGVVGHASNAMW